MALKVTKKYEALLAFAQKKKLKAIPVYLRNDTCCGIGNLQSVGLYTTKEAQASFVLGFHTKVTSNTYDTSAQRNVLYYAPHTIIPYKGIVAFLKSLGFKKIGGHTINPKYGTRELGIYLLKQE